MTENHFRKTVINLLEPKHNSIENNALVQSFKVFSFLKITRKFVSIDVIEESANHLLILFKKETTCDKN